MRVNGLFSPRLFSPDGFLLSPRNRRTLALRAADGPSSEERYTGPTVTLRDARDVYLMRNTIRDAWALEMLGPWENALRDSVLALGTPTLDAIDSADVPWSPEIRRERASILQRQAALLRSGSGFCSYRPSLTVVLCSNRPGNLSHALRQISHQRDVEMEVIIGGHGRDWDEPATRRQIRHALAEVTNVVRSNFVAIPDDVNLGAALNTLVRRASGDVVARIDDDDWYGPTHLRDLSMALHYSGADLVGCVAEFVYFEDANETVRRSLGQAEVAAVAYETARVSGGTMVFSRAIFDAVDGFPEVQRYEDGGFSDRVHNAGSFLYRAHAHGFLHRRGGGDHTYVGADDHFRIAQVEHVAGRASLIG